MKAAVIVFPGTNREQDMMRALKKGGANEVSAVWHAETELPGGTDLVVLPGGFSYGDYLRSGAIAARAPVMAAVADHAKKGGLALGVCNGFQMLCEAGLLRGTLMRNAGLTFICKEVHLRVEATNSAFTNGYRHHQVVRFPVAHHDGNYFADRATLDRLEGENRVAFRYCAPDGTVDPKSPTANPNGSQRAIAGILSENRNILGLMPHPENLVEELLGGTDGLPLFESLGLAA